jgi:hypothetical protein
MRKMLALFAMVVIMTSCGNNKTTETDQISDEPVIIEEVSTETGGASGSEDVVDKIEEPAIK